MPKYLILAEKKSVAKKVAQGIGKGKFQDKGSYFVAKDGNTEAHVYYLFGHILQVDLEKTFGEGYGQFPTLLKRKVAQGRGKLYKAIKEALEKAKKGEYKEVVVAGDPDREGELLVREVLEVNRVPKNLCSRMWWNSETPSALREAFYSRKPLSQFDALYVAGKCRQLGDLWLGINLSRVLQEKSGNRTLSLGRVQTPTLKLIVDRHKEIENFKPEPYWIIKAVCEKGKKFTATYKEKLKEESKAKEVYERLKATPYLVVKKVEKKLKKKSPPKLPKISDLQSTIGRRFRATAKEVLSATQKLYEAGYVSYPRTEANYLADKDQEVVESYLRAVGKTELISKLNDKTVRKRIFNTKAVEKAGHHAIVPLKPLDKQVSPLERAVFQEVERRLFANLMPDYEYEETTAWLVIPDTDYLFKAVGKVDVNLGWRALYKGANADEEKEEDAAQALPPLTEGEQVRKVKEVFEKKFTQPPSHYTSATLTKTLERLGLGTEATRHIFEEVLIKRGYVKRVKGKLYPTEEGIKLIEQIKDYSFTTPEETAKWEKVLEKIAFKDKNPQEGEREFLEGIKKLTLQAIKELESQDFSYLSKKPSQKMVNYARLISEKAGVSFDEERARTDFGYVKEIIEKYKDKVEQELKELDKPTQKQVELLNKLKEQGLKIPDKAYQSKRYASKVIQNALKRSRKGKRYGKKRRS